MKKSIITFLLTLTITGITNAQKTSRGDCRTRIEANYERGVYLVNITNQTCELTSYQVDFPDGKSKITRLVRSGETLPVQQGSANLIFYGSIIVTPLNQAPANCPFGSVQVNLW